MENTHRRPSGKRPKKRFRGNQFMKVCPHTNVAEKERYSNVMHIGQRLESLKTFCAVMSLPNPVEQKSYDVINNKLSRVMKEVAEESMKRAAVEENSSSPNNFLTVCGYCTLETRGISSLIGVYTVIGSETGKVWNREVMSSFCKGCDSYKGVKFGIKYNKWQRVHQISCRKNYSGSADKFGLKIKRNVCVSLAERDNRRMFTSRQRRLESSFEARRVKKIKKSKEIELFQKQEGISYDPGAF
ncbi:uncharacterized protein TNCV_1556181 [Trichonephila clavipes]|nr:uncharacterized protein TNCV_1556181 [Trichonephila clavipes]